MTFETLRTRTDVPVIIANSSGRIVFVNARFTEMFGWSSDEAVGQLLTLIIPQSLHDAHHPGFSRFVETGSGRLLGKPLNLRARDKTGREFDAEHHILAEKQGEEWSFGATIKPIA